MPRKLVETFADAYAVVAQDLQRQVGDSLAATAGPPTTMEVDPVTEADRIKAWNTPHPEATDRAMMRLAQQKYAEHSRSGMTPEDAVTATAEDLTHFRYRARQTQYVAGTVGWAEQVREAERLARAAARKGPPPVAPAPPSPYMQAPPASDVMLQAPQGMPPGMPPGMPWGMPPGMPPGMPWGMPPGMPPGMPQGMPPQGMPPQGMPPPASDVMLQGMPSPEQAPPEMMPQARPGPLPLEG